MNQVRLTRPKYAESFRCIGSSCEDTCCEGWNVPLKKADAERFAALPEGVLKNKLLAAIETAPEGAGEDDGFGKDAFARLKMNGVNRCPMLTADNLCRLQAECGHQSLPHTCAIYPRNVHEHGGFAERSLALSCPEAARHVLLNPQLLVPTARHLAADDAPWLPPHFWRIRETAVGLVRNRAYPLWKRMFLLNVLCRRLDEIGAGSLQSDARSFLDNFEATIQSGRLNQAMDSEPIDCKAQLDAVLRLAGLLLKRSNIRPRFTECINEFTLSIGNKPTATLDSLTAGFTEAHDRYFAPYFEKRPHILENWLLNTIFRTQFPYGPDGLAPGVAVNFTREFVRLTAQFALIKGLLIGVAGFHRELFSTEELIKTVQAASKHFDHHPEFPKLAQELLTELRLDGAHGLAVLLRNAAPAAPRPAVPAPAAPGPWPEKSAVPPAVANVN